jgi:CheY-like chemotaxis protein
MNLLPNDLPTPIDESSPPFQDLHFLVIDDNPDGRFLVSKTLLRKFPNSIIVEAQTAEAAFRALEKGSISLIVCHRTFEFDAISLVVEIRKRNAAVPVVAMSGIDRTTAVREAGADAFLTYDQWLMIGNHVATLLLERASGGGAGNRMADPLESR